MKVKYSHHHISIHPEDSDMEKSDVVDVDGRIQRSPVKIPAKQIKRVKKRELRCVIKRDTTNDRIDPIRKSPTRERPRNVREQRQYEMCIVLKVGNGIVTLQKLSEEDPVDS